MALCRGKSFLSSNRTAPRVPDAHGVPLAAVFQAG